MSRKSTMQLIGVCPFCDQEAVHVTRESQEDPWRAICSGCGTIWDYVTVQMHNGNQEILAGDGEITVSLGINLQMRKGKLNVRNTHPGPSGEVSGNGG